MINPIRTQRISILDLPPDVVSVFCSYLTCSAISHFFSMTTILTHHSLPQYEMTWIKQNSLNLKLLNIQEISKIKNIVENNETFEFKDLNPKDFRLLNMSKEMSSNFKDITLVIFNSIIAHFQLIKAYSKTNNQVPSNHSKKIIGISPSPRKMINIFNICLKPTPSTLKETMQNLMRYREYNGASKHAWFITEQIREENKFKHWRGKRSECYIAATLAHIYSEGGIDDLLELFKNVRSICQYTLEGKYTFHNFLLLDIAFTMLILNRDADLKWLFKASTNKTENDQIEDIDTIINTIEKFIKNQNNYLRYESYDYSQSICALALRRDVTKLSQTKNNRWEDIPCAMASVGPQFNNLEKLINAIEPIKNSPEENKALFSLMSQMTTSGYHMSDLVSIGNLITNLDARDQSFAEMALIMITANYGPCDVLAVINQIKNPELLDTTLNYSDAIYNFKDEINQSKGLRDDRIVENIFARLDQEKDFKYYRIRIKIIEAALKGPYESSLDDLLNIINQIEDHQNKIVILKEMICAMAKANYDVYDLCIALMEIETYERHSFIPTFALVMKSYYNSESILQILQLQYKDAMTKDSLRQELHMLSILEDAKQQSLTASTSCPLEFLEKKKNEDDHPENEIIKIVSEEGLCSLSKTMDVISLLGISVDISIRTIAKNLSSNLYRQVQNKMLKSIALLMISDGHPFKDIEKIIEKIRTNVSFITQTYQVFHHHRLQKFDNNAQYLNKKKDFEKFKKEISENSAQGIREISIAMALAKKSQFNTKNRYYYSITENNKILKLDYLQAEKIAYTLAYSREDYKRIYDVVKRIKGSTERASVSRQVAMIMANFPDHYPKAQLLHLLTQCIGLNSSPD